MKILLINVVCGIRSTGRICTDLATALEAQGNEVKIAYGRETVPKQFQKYAVRIGSDLDVKMHGLKARLFDGAGFGSKLATIKFIEWIKKYDPDVIHIHNIHGYYINVEILFKYLKICEKKVIWTLHDCWAFTGHTAYCDSIQCKQWKYGCKKCSLIREYPSSLIDRSSYNWERKKEIFTNVPNMTIVTPSYWLENLVKESFLKNYNVVTIHNGIDISKFHYVESEFKKINKIEDKFVLLGVATSWDKNKGLKDFEKLSEKLDDRFQIVLVGLSKKQISKLPSKIIGIERTSSVKELAEIYSASDLFLNLSYCENYPTVNIEALACNTPIVVYNVGGNSEIVEQCGGTVVQRGNINELVDVIKNAEKGSAKNIEFVPEENSIEAVNKKYLTLIESIKISTNGESNVK